MAAGAKGRIDVNAIVVRRERGQHRVGQHRDMRCGWHRDQRGVPAGGPADGNVAPPARERPRAEARCVLKRSGSHS
jgi:hypothetical protein